MGTREKENLQQYKLTKKLKYSNMLKHLIKFSVQRSITEIKANVLRFWDLQKGSIYYKVNHILAYNYKRAWLRNTTSTDSP